ncbi:hypothetical protein H5410_062266 [Solanum commersonii]|uniref:Uncharacterized protein n=1 Tax=Solanum commersonii TaxID=4109 RepID=A0A9J5WB31_SOLCO|nr:hypothetical protein H5410_062266 [Solanum commersonii]
MAILANFLGPFKPFFFQPFFWAQLHNIQPSPLPFPISNPAQDQYNIQPKNTYSDQTTQTVPHHPDFVFSIAKPIKKIASSSRREPERESSSPTRAVRVVSRLSLILRTKNRSRCRNRVARPPFSQNRSHALV